MVASRVKQVAVLYALNRWLFYRVTTVQEFARVDSVLVVLDEWTSYRGGRLGKFNCNALS